MRLKELRDEHGLTQAELGRLLNISPSAIGMYEQGRREPSIEALIKIADYFCVTTDYLLGRITENQEKWIQKIARQIVDADTPPSERFTSGLLPGLLDDPRRDVIEKITNMDEQSVKAVKGIVDVMYNKKTEAGSRDVE